MADLHPNCLFQRTRPIQSINNCPLAYFTTAIISTITISSQSPYHLFIEHDLYNYQKILHWPCCPLSPPQPSSPPPPSKIFISFSLNTAGTIIKRLPLARLTSNQSRSSIALRASFSPFSSLVRHLSHLTLYLSSSFSFLIYMSYIPVYCASSNGNGFLHHILTRLQDFSLRNPFQRLR